MDNDMQPFAPQPSSRPEQNGQGGQNDQNNQMNQDHVSEESQIDPQLPPAMENTETENSASQSASNQPSYQQGQTASLDNQGGPMINNTGVNLESPILAPTHFDGMKAPEMTGTIGSATAPSHSSQTDSERLFKTLSIVFGALAFIGTILGIWSLVSNMGTSQKLAAAQKDLVEKNAIVAKIESDTGKKIITADDVPAYATMADTIYIPEWGISFKIPEDLENVSYTVDQKYRPQICFTGHKTGIKYFPAFADIDQNTATLGCVTRVESYEGDSDKDTGKSFGQKFYTYGDYNYFYTAPEAHFSQEASEQGLEDTAVQIIKNMITNNISHYE